MVDIPATRIASQFKLCMCMKELLCLESNGNGWRYPMTRLAGMQRKIGEGTLSRLNAARGSAAGLLDHLGPKFEGWVFALRISKLPAKFFLITFREDFQVE